MFALTELLGLPVFDTSGNQSGRVRELGLTPTADRAHVAMFIVRTKTGDRILPCSAISSINGGIRASTGMDTWAISDASEGLFLLARDLLDQQIIDVHGRKVVRVNDVDLHEETGSHNSSLKVGSVDVGARGAVRRLLKGVVPMGALRALLGQIPPRPIPWEFVDLTHEQLRLDCRFRTGDVALRCIREVIELFKGRNADFCLMRDLVAPPRQG